MEQTFSINQEFEWIKFIRFPLIYTESTYEKVLKKVLNSFKENIKKSFVLNQSEKIEIIKYANSIIKVYRLYSVGNFKAAYDEFDERTTYIKSKMLFTYVGYKNSYNNVRMPYYRVVGSMNCNFKYLQMLHVPFCYRNQISTNRFSASGIPCSYMSTEKTVAWYECGMPDKFQIATFEVVDDCKKKLLQMDINPLTLFHKVRGMFLRQDNGNQDIAVEIIKRYYYIFPLLAACSISRSGKKNKFSDEYIIPQLLMSWIVQDQDVIGIRYSTNVKYENAHAWNAHNIAIPAKYPFDANGYSKQLKEIFQVSERRAKEKSLLVTVDYKEMFQKINKKNMEIVSLFHKDVEEIIKNKEFTDTLVEYKMLCAVFEENIISLMNSSGCEKYSYIVTLSSLHYWVKWLLENVKEELTSSTGITFSLEEFQNTEGIKKRFKEDIVPIIIKMRNIDFIE